MEGSEQGEVQRGAAGVDEGSAGWEAGFGVKHISHYLARLGLVKEPELPKAVNARDIYQFGYENGMAWGEVVGRRQAFEDLLEHLRLSGKGLEETQPGDVVDVRVKSTH